MKELKEFLIKQIIEEEDIVQELLTIDNNICFTNLTIGELIKKIEMVKELENIEGNFNVITSGEIEEILASLLNYSLKIKKINVAKRMLAISTYLTSRIKKFWQGLDSIELDRDNDYQFYIDDKTNLVIVGSSLFAGQMAKLNFQKDVIQIKMD